MLIVQPPIQALHCKLLNKQARLILGLLVYHISKLIKLIGLRLAYCNFSLLSMFQI